MNKRIAEVTAGGEQEFLASRLIQDGVVRNLEVIGEATKNLSIELREANPQLRDVAISETTEADRPVCGADTQRQNYLISRW